MENLEIRNVTTEEQIDLIEKYSGAGFTKIGMQKSDAVRSLPCVIGLWYRTGRFPPHIGFMPKGRSYVLDYTFRNTIDVKDYLKLNGYVEPPKLKKIKMYKYWHAALRRSYIITTETSRPWAEYKKQYAFAPTLYKTESYEIEIPDTGERV